MEAKDPAVVRAVLSVLSIYRVMYAYPKLKLQSITDPFKGQTRSLPQYEVDLVISKYLGQFLKPSKYFDKLKVF